MKHRKILEVRIRVAGEETNEDAAEQPPRIDRRTARRVANEPRHVIVRRIVFVVAGSLAEQLIEFFKMAFGAARQPIESFHHQLFFIKTCEPRNLSPFPLATLYQ